MPSIIRKDRLIITIKYINEYTTDTEETQSFVFNMLDPREPQMSNKEAYRSRGQERAQS